jgi:hypothetical protein
MSVRWYSDELEKYPPLIIAIMERVRYYFAQMLYPSLSYNFTSVKTDPIEKAKEEAKMASKNRFVLTDITDRALQDSSKIFQMSNGIFPFTTFNYGELDLDDTRFNMYANLGFVYESQFDCKIEARPSNFHVSMVTFFATGFDYWRAQTLLNRDSSSKSLLWVPIKINNVSTEIPILLEFEELSKGTYAYEFATQLSTGKIQDIVHDITIHFYDLVCDTEINLVEDIELYMKSYFEDDHRGYKQSELSVMPDTPTVSSTSPVDGASGVLVGTNIVMNFSEVMSESSVESAIYFDPYISANFIWNSNSTSIVVDPRYDLTSGTMYSGTLYTTAKSARGVPIEEDYEFGFKTEGVAPE